MTRCPRAAIRADSSRTTVSIPPPSGSPGPRCPNIAIDKVFFRRFISYPYTVNFSPVPSCFTCCHLNCKQRTIACSLPSRPIKLLFPLPSCPDLSCRMPRVFPGLFPYKLSCSFYFFSSIHFNLFRLALTCFCNPAFTILLLQFCFHNLASAILLSQSCFRNLASAILPPQPCLRVTRSPCLLPRPIQS